MTSTFTRGHPFHARLYDRICGWEERRGMANWRRALVADLDGQVLEIGTGTGRNLPYYGRDVTILASEFDPVMFALAQDRARKCVADVKLFLADAMRLPLRDKSMDAVVIGMALCSILNPKRALAEVRRVLRPQGRLRFIEHVRDEDGTVRARVQDLANPAWRVISGGCNCNRRTLDVVASSGFEVRECERFKIGLPLLKPHVWAEASPR